MRIDNKPASRVAILRRKAGLTQQALADKAGLNIRLVQKLESGESKAENITLRNAIAIANALGANPEDLI